MGGLNIRSAQVGGGVRPADERHRITAGGVFSQSRVGGGGCDGVATGNRTRGLRRTYNHPIHVKCSRTLYGCGLKERRDLQESVGVKPAATE